MTTVEYQPETVDRSPDKSGGKGVETPEEIQGVKAKKLKPSLKVMSKARRAVVKKKLAKIQKTMSLLLETKEEDEKLLDFLKLDEGMLKINEKDQLFLCLPRKKK